MPDMDDGALLPTNTEVPSYLRTQRCPRLYTVVYPQRCPLTYEHALNYLYMNMSVRALGTAAWMGPQNIEFNIFLLPHSFERAPF